MLKEQIFEKMNGFLTEGGYLFRKKRQRLQMSFLQKRSVGIFTMRCTRQSGEYVCVWAKRRTGI